MGQEEPFFIANRLLPFSFPLSLSRDFLVYRLASATLNKAYSLKILRSDSRHLRREGQVESRAWDWLWILLRFLPPLCQLRRKQGDSRTRTAACATTYLATALR